MTDEGSKPLAGVAVYVEGTSSATFTEADGRYTITVSDNSTITYAMLGYISKAEKVGNRRYINAVLIEDSAFAISDAVVTGYSTQDRRNVTGAISTVKLPEVRPAGATLDQLLTGMAAGVFVSTSSGGLGSANLLTIRGVSSIMGDNNPLYVIDGVPIYGPDRGANSISTTGGAIGAVAMGSMTTGGGSLASISDMINQNFERNPLTSLNPE
ncbi:MAG: carboxypeptidase-like regulatory domain-containing protein, partial [Bacteroidales bacterium]|nr:carboxypeptidase-like regulatory domain-containing protein [Candidatus Cryptobacteroides faecihippi]